MTLQGLGTVCYTDGVVIPCPSDDFSNDCSSPNQCLDGSCPPCKGLLPFEIPRVGTGTNFESALFVAGALAAGYAIGGTKGMVLGGVIVVAGMGIIMRGALK